mmetsp:Transcript_52386/g.113511  ORF Transcript_52386/g.113511 Transcript_52386/m.113511 type:complete len:324 (-) Transcript_52386:2-973(-)
MSSPSIPYELAAPIFRRVPPVDFLRSVAATCKSFSFAWYCSSFPSVVTVPDDVPSLNEGINRLANEGCGGQGLLLVRPGIYSESLRVTQNCWVLGLGPRNRVVVEAPGWESALVSAGLGARHVPNLFGWESFTSGEDTRVENLTFRCRNENMRGRCVYIVMGQLHLIHCDVDGAVLVGGCRTAPKLEACRVRGSRGSGLHFTDHCHASLTWSEISAHGSNGVLIDRGARPVVTRNLISKNQRCGIRALCGASPSSRGPGLGLGVLKNLGDNTFEGNVGGELSADLLFADEEEDEVRWGEDCVAAERRALELEESGQGRTIAVC